MLPLTVMLKNGTGSPGVLRPGADGRLARSTTLPLASKASRSAGDPVDAQNDIVTDETGLGKVARTGMDSVAIAETIPLLPVARWVKNISCPFPLLCRGSCASVNMTPFSSH